MKLPQIFADYTGKQKITSFLIGLGFSIVVILGIFYNLMWNDKSYDDNPFSGIDDRITDRFFQERFRDYKDLPVPVEVLRGLAVVAIDDESLGSDEFPRWPIPRSRYGELLDRLKVGGAKTIGFDIIFDCVSDEDEGFVYALENMDNVFLPIYYFDSTKISAEEMGMEGEESGSLMIKYPCKPLNDALQKNTKPGESRVGFVSTEISDVPRWTNLSIDVGGKTFYALSIMLAAHFKDIPQDKIKYSPGGKNFSLGDIKIPLAKNQARINYIFAPPVYTYKLSNQYNLWNYMEHYSIQDVFQMEEQDLKDCFGGRLVLIGVTAQAGMDLKPSPFGQIPGLYNHVNMIASFLGNNFIRPASPWFNLLVILAAGLLIGLVIPRFTPVPGAILTVLLCYGYYAFSYWRFTSAGVINFIAAPLFCAILSFIAINIYHQLAEMKARQSISKMFKEFAPLPSPLIEKYVEECGGNAATGGTLAHVTILFADIRGYTDLSENLSSQEVMNLLNEYHEAMGKVFAETGGVIFTYIGDAQLVVYGLDEKSKTNHAASAIQAGLMMQERLEELSEKWRSENRRIFEVGVGLCTGQLSIGVVGSSQLKQYTVIGDTVNVASRIQGMSRELASPTLIHERTYLMAKDCIEADALRPVKLKGKKEPVYVYRARKVLEITPYPGDEIKDLDREVKELHQQRREQIEKLQNERQAGEGRRERAAARKRVRTSRKEEEEPSKETTGEPSELDLLMPLEEKSKGQVFEEEKNGEDKKNP